METSVLDQLRKVLDPELGVSIVDLGLIYGINVSPEKVCTITMTLTTIGCPLFGQIQKEIEDRVMELESIDEVVVNLVFDPVWTAEKMSEEARIQLGLD